MSKAKPRPSKVRGGKAYFRTCCPKCRHWFKDWIWVERLGRKGVK